MNRIALIVAALCAAFLPALPAQQVPTSTDASFTYGGGGDTVGSLPWEWTYTSPGMSTTAAVADGTQTLTTEWDTSVGKTSCTTEKRADESYYDFACRHRIAVYEAQRAMPPIAFQADRAGAVLAFIQHFSMVKKLAA